ncbi:Acetyltransferase, GNAT family [Bifidobacterium coryneforme]|uniref:Acetyltransferase, GNAT family n=1 Tax=Bifidobacterium coryneforme TaxID=1687 RepID=A0ABD4AC02_9BIFI|nr:GNAT family protein [Bifidobacterium coryneforme]KJY52708.1 Acetyltransferase, GNAT family [Bifidobacterium coryneforme]
MSVLQSLRDAWHGSQSRDQTRALILPDRLTAPPGHGDFCLRPIRESDQEEWNRVRWDNRDWLAPWESGDPTHGPGMSYAQWMSSLERSRREGSSALFLMEFQTRLVGQVSLGAICYGAMRTAVVGYWVAEQWIGHGFAPLSLALLADWAFRADTGPHLHRIEVAILPENQRSLAVARKVGLKPEGLRRGYMYVNGAWRDHLTFSLLSEDYDPRILDRL